MNHPEEAPAVRALSMEEIREVYHSRMERDFPRDELKPLSMIESALGRGEYRCLGYRDGRGLLAYAFFVLVARDGRSLCLFDYLAVREDLRDTGVGGRFLRALWDTPLSGVDCLLLEVDDPEAATDAAERARRERRLAFYLRNGLVETGVTARVFGVDFRLLERPLSAPHAPEAVRGAYASLYRSMLSEPLYRQAIHIR